MEEERERRRVGGREIENERGIRVMEGWRKRGREEGREGGREIENERRIRRAEEKNG